MKSTPNRRRRASASSSPTDLPVTEPGLADYRHGRPAAKASRSSRQSRQICIDGVKHGGRYQIRVRGGLPAADGETLAHPAELDVYVRDRAPWVGFAGNAYVLPAGPGASIPLVSVNTDKALATIYRIGDRGLAAAIRDGQFLRQLSALCAPSNIAEQSGEKVWEGEIDITSKLNETITTAMPIADARDRRSRPAPMSSPPRPSSRPNEWGNLATQWFVVSDLGLTTLSGNDGVHAIVRSLSTAAAGRRRQGPPRRHQQRRARRSDDRRQRLCALRPGPRPRQGRHGAAAHRRRARRTATTPSST